MESAASTTRSNADHGVAQGRVADQLQRRGLNRFVNCVGESALTEYGDSSGHTFGYVYNPGAGGGTFDTGAIAPTESGTTVNEWGLYDKCNTTSSPSLRRAHVARMSGPIAQEGSPFAAGALAFP